jgi:excisionase family DNA binding protein
MEKLSAQTLLLGFGRPLMPINSTGLSDHEVGGGALGGGALRPVTPKEVAAILGCNLKSVYAAIERGEIPVIKIGRLFLIPRRRFERLLTHGDEAE